MFHDLRRELWLDALGTQYPQVEVTGLSRKIRKCMSDKIKKEEARQRS